MIEEIIFETRLQWREWLQLNHQTTKGVWLVYFKKASGKPHLSYDEAVEEALCFGWIDSKPGKIDDEKSKQYYCPRNPKSNWSALNKTRVEHLRKAGLMTEAGEKMITIAIESGTWTALDDVENLVIPDDLQIALDNFEKANTNFLAFPKSVKRGILEWIKNAKTTETRQKRINETSTLANENIRANQYVKK